MTAANRAPRERGQAMVEMAIVLPVLAILLFGLIQFGLLFRDYLALVDAVRAGARVAAVSRGADDPAGAARTTVREAGTDLDVDELDIDVTSSWAQGSEVRVAATYPYEINLLGIVVASGDLRSETRERVE
jgi:Flp pilus assembly protein TadG